MTDQTRAARNQRALMQRRVGVFLAGMLLIATIFYITAMFSLTMLAQKSGAAVFWPASGVAVGAILAFGRPSRWPVAAGVALATVAANLAAGRAPAVVLPFAVANVLECLTVAWLVDRFLGQDLRFDTLRAVLGVFLAAAIGTMIGAAIGAGAIKLLSNAEGPFITHWHQWFRSGLVGVIALTPLVIGLRTLATHPVSMRTHIEGILLLALLSATAVAIFPNGFHGQSPALNIPIALLFPALLLVAIRHPLTYSPIGASAVALIMVASIVIEAPEATAGDVLRAQITIFAAVACSLSLSALIAERSSGEERQKLLIRELDHRVKNGLTLVQAVVERSRESATSIEDFYAALGGRIRSMGRTHSMLSREKWQGLELAELIRTELAPYQDSGPDTLTGPRVVLRPALAQSLSLVLHELSTNAVKHGALSRPEGRVMVTWHIEGVRAKGGAMELVIEWRERGVAVPREIGPEGFGTSTIRDLLKYEAGAEVLLAFPASGAECTIRLPVVAGDITLL